MSTQTRTSIEEAVLALLRNNGHKTFRPKEMAKRLGYFDNHDYRLFRTVLAELDEDRRITRMKGGRYTHKRKLPTLEGRLHVNPKGFGFVSIEGRDQDLFVSEKNLATALDGDQVRVEIIHARGSYRTEAEVLAVVERSRTKTVGTFKRQGTFAFVHPDDQKLTHNIYVPSEAFNGAQHNDTVIVSIDRFENRYGAPEGRVLSILGPASDPNVQVLAIAANLNVDADFSTEALAEAQALSVAIPASEYDRRLDLRHQQIFTIDPEDAKDFDDAIHVDVLPNGNIELGVHIADVSHYVTAESALDTEGHQRATSVYLVDRVIPMLPEKLSNEVCSLRPHEDKLTYSCLMEVTVGGEVVKHKICETVIHSYERFTYAQAQAILDGTAIHPTLTSALKQAGALAQTLTANRSKAGSIDFDLPEVKVLLDEGGNPVKIEKRERVAAHRLIEECMLLANRVVAKSFQDRFPSRALLFRVHEPPAIERLTQLAAYVRLFGHRLPTPVRSITAADLNALLHAVEDRPEGPVIKQASLRSMAKAKYTTANVGHYGLAFPHYCHFTSPIRRYPDLLTHRLLKAALAGDAGLETSLVEATCKHCSAQERNAEEAERESIKLKQVVYMQRHLGDSFTGVISSVTKYGVYVMLDDVFVEGMVHVRDMNDDYYDYDEQTFSLVGAHFGTRYRPGDTVSVVVVRADTEAREIDLFFV